MKLLLGFPTTVWLGLSLSAKSFSTLSASLTHCKIISCGIKPHKIQHKVVFPSTSLELRDSLFFLESGASSQLLTETLLPAPA